MEWSIEGMKAKLPIQVNFSQPWKSYAYCKANVHLTTLTGEYYMDEDHTEWKLPVTEIENEKWKILSWVVAEKKAGGHSALHEESDPRPWGSAFLCYTTEATFQGTRWCSVSMVSDVVHQKTRNPEVWCFTAEEKLKCYRCPWFMTKQKTFFILLTLSRNCLVFFSGLSPHPLLTMVIVISISITYKTESEKGEIGLNFKVLLVSALLSKITSTY